jgi:hypothetical protein
MKTFGIYLASLHVKSDATGVRNFVHWVRCAPDRGRCLVHTKIRSIPNKLTPPTSVAQLVGGVSLLLAKCTSLVQAERAPIVRSELPWLLHCSSQPYSTQPPKFIFVLCRLVNKLAERA